MRKGRVGGALITVSSALDAAVPTHFPDLVQSFRWFDQLVAEHPESLAKAVRSGDLDRARRTGRIALMMAIEGGDQIDGSLDKLRASHARGVRSMTIVYDHHNRIGDGAMAFPSSAGIAGRPASGLTWFGRAVVAEMNRLGMIVDLSHAAEPTAEQALAMSAAPILFSHSAARALADSPRNLSDSMLSKIRSGGGLVMVPLAPYLTTHASWRWFQAGEANFARLEALYGNDRAQITSGLEVWDRANPPPPVSMGDVADQVEYIARWVGRDQVGIGSDFDGMGEFVVAGLADVEALPALFTELARRGWTSRELEGLASGNFRRLFQSVEQTSRRLSAIRGSSPTARRRPC